MKKYEVEKLLWEKAPTLIPKYWNKLSTSSKEKIIKDFSSKIYEDISEFENVLANIRNREENINFFIYGIVVGISGSLVSDAISKLFDKIQIFGTYLQLMLGIGLFSYLLWGFGKYLRQKNDSTFKASKVAVSFSEYAKKKLQETNTKKHS